MIFLPNTTAAFNHERFEATVKQELAAQDDFAKHLQQSLQFGSYALLDELEIMITKIAADDTHLHIQIGAFYHSFIAGCNCADDPSPVEKNDEYAEISVIIDRQNATAILKAL